MVVVSHWSVTLYQFNTSEFSEAMEKLFKELYVLNIAETNVISTHTKQDTIVSSSNHQVSSSKLYPSFTTTKNILDWVQIFAQEWLISHNLVYIPPLLTNCNGTSLLYLDDLSRTSNIKQSLRLLQEDSLLKKG